MKSDRSCEICKGGHGTTDCQMTQEQVEYLGYQNCNNSYGHEMMDQLLERDERRYQENVVKFKEHDTMIQSQGVALQNLERHVG
ncbi:hypothetical protein L1987_14913 [Smallanthus sonchifolius]|uniref:Uncharacterized protein n=1 Tax=Smallanthus sonchifolius TaxID=185202 RepID=A0ACB9J562_9ASTR|nr:hypothetical protein L1987_14913 [Smallanthus sonchifolius]